MDNSLLAVRNINHKYIAVERKMQTIMQNVMWHVALEPGSKKMQDVIVAKMAFNDLEQIGSLLGTNRVKGSGLEAGNKGYFIMYGGEYERPYPSIIIWKYKVTEDGNIICDLEQEDGWILKQIWRDWLVGENETCSYEPPKSFLIMERKENLSV